MVHKCCVPNCKESSDNKTSEISFHVFPTDPERRKKWLEAINCENFTPTKYTSICSKHFEKSCFVGNRLFKDACPTMFELPDITSIKQQLTYKLGVGEVGNIQTNEPELPVATTSGISVPGYENMNIEPDTAVPSSSRFYQSSSDLKLRTPERLSNLQEKSDSGSSISSPLLSASHLMKRLKRDIPHGTVEKSPRSSATSISGITVLSEERLMRKRRSGHSSSMLTASEAVIEINKSKVVQKKMSKRYYKPKYVGDCLSDDMITPRKTKRNWAIAKHEIKIQKRKIMRLHQKRRRLEMCVKTLSSLMKELRDKHNLTEQAESLVLASLSDSAKALFEKMLGGSKKQKFSPELRSFALTLHFYSAKAYNFVRDKFNKSLPHPATITKWFQSVNGEPGFTQEALEALKLKVAEAKLKNSKVLCNMVMDEMYIRTQEIWTGKDFKGHVNIGTSFSDDVELATQALVFMLVAINSNWKIPVGYFSLNSLGATEKANLVNRCLEFLGQSDIQIVSLTFDGAPVNLTMMSKLGASINVPAYDILRTKFSHPTSNKPVYFLLDACHMLKLIRNCLASVQQLQHDDGGIIRWDYFKKLCDLQEKEGLHAGTKLRKRHVRWYEEKMRVKTAAQTFSRSVADALTYLNVDLQLEDFAGCEETVKFCLLINDLFDIFNSRNFMCKYKFKRPLDINTFTNIFEKFEEVKIYFSKLKIDGRPILQSKRKTGFLGFLIDIESITNIFKDLIACEAPELKFLLLYKFSQDHLEIFFSAVRSRGGFNNNPNAKQFETAYKRLLIHSEVKGSTSGNCIALDATSILHVSSRSINKSQIGQDLTESEEYKHMLNETDHNYTSSEVWHLTIFQNDVVGYIAGFVVKRLKKCISCEECYEILETHESLSTLQIRKMYGRLTNASQFVISVCRAGEKCYRITEKSNNLRRSNIIYFLTLQTISSLPSHLFDIFTLKHLLNDEITNNHSIQLTKQILKHYFNLRIHHSVSSFNAVKEKERIRKKLTKSIHFQNQ